MIELHITEESIERTDYNNKGEVRFRLDYPHIDNIPEDVRTKLAAMQLMADGTDVPDIGHKVSSSIYWIYDDPADFAYILNNFQLALIKADQEKRLIRTYIGDKNERD